MQGILFDIKQMAVYDGPGVRTTIFLKGCPLSCQWCHNPEGISPKQQLLVRSASCLHCGRCAEICRFDADPQRCTACGACVSVCPLHLRSIAGTAYEPQELAELLLQDRTILESMGGGITFSGSEPLQQSAFLLQLIPLLQGMHCTMETCGFSSREVFSSVIAKMDHIIMDIKMIDERQHRRYCGAGNRPILENLQILRSSGKPFVIRVPLIPGVNDTKENLCRTAELLEGAAALQRVELLPYQKTAGAKYRMLSMSYEPEFDVDREPAADTSCFTERGIACTVL